MSLREGELSSGLGKGTIPIAMTHDLKNITGPNGNLDTPEAIRTELLDKIHLNLQQIASSQGVPVQVKQALGSNKFNDIGMQYEPTVRKH